MRIIETKAFKFDELSDEAKGKAIEKWRNETIRNGDYWFVEEAHATFEKWTGIFNCKWREINYEEPYRSDYSFGWSDEVLKLSGIRLYKYLWNNFAGDIFKGKYYPVESGKKISHQRVKSKELKNGIIFNAYYSAINLEHSCVLTGVCYDENILAPIYEFLEKPNFRIDFEDLLNDCIYSLCHAVQSEIEYQTSDEGIKGTILANEYEFTEDGDLI